MEFLNAPYVYVCAMVMSGAGCRQGDCAAVLAVSHLQSHSLRRRQGKSEMIRHAIMVSALFGLAACSKNDPAAEPSAAPSEVSATPVAAAGASEAAVAAPAPTPAPAATAAAAPSVDFAKLAVNTRLEVTRQTQCREADASKGSPWDLAPGVTVKFLAIEGAEAKVATLMSQCYLPADAVKLAQ